MLRLRLVGGVRRPPLLKNPSGTTFRTLYQTRALAAAVAAKTHSRIHPSRHQPTMDRGRQARQSPASSKNTELPGPLNSEKAILTRFMPVDVDAKMLKFPKEQLSLYVRKLTDAPPHYACESGFHDGKQLWRCANSYVRARCILTSAAEQLCIPSPVPMTSLALGIML